MSTKTTNNKTRVWLLGALLFVTLLLATLVLIINKTPEPNVTNTKVDAQEVSVPLKVTITYPAWGTTLKWKSEARIEATVEHTYPLDRVVFQVNTNNTKNVCTLTEEPFTCTYTVPYTGNGRGGGGTAGYGVSVYAYDAAGNVGMNVVQMWSYK